MHDAETLVSARLAARGRRTRRLRRTVAVLAIAVFMTAWLVIYVQLASGHDPALTASTKKTATVASASTSSSSSSTGGSSSASDDSGKSSSAPRAPAAPPTRRGPRPRAPPP